METTELARIISQFKIEGKPVEISTFGSGHIHATYRAKNTESGKADYILQRVNHHIFKHVPELMRNISLVTEHLKAKLSNLSNSEIAKKVLTIVPTREGALYYRHTDGSYWRVFIFLANTISYDLVETEQQACEGGRAYGQFQSLLADFDSKQLFEILPNFHNIQFRLDQLQEAIDKNPVNRLQKVADQINFVRSRETAMKRIMHMGKEGKIPVRITHNDTKFNNVLLDQDDHVQCVIDLDTVMPGYMAYDFGDAIRTIVNTTVEDEKDLTKIDVNMRLLKSFADGFISQVSGTLSRNEVLSLAYGCLLLPFIMGVRFLTDYIDGDNYYKIHFPGHNIQRAKSQFRLVEKLEENYSEIEATILNIYEQNKH